MWRRNKFSAVSRWVSPVSIVAHSSAGMAVSAGIEERFARRLADLPDDVGVIRIGGDDGFSDSAGLAGARYDGEPGTAYLLRPDGYVAARFRHPTRAALDAALARAAGHN